jgi:glycosyltransferase involved in cell wall biosynthesis
VHPGIKTSIRIRFEHTRYPHWGGHSGYIQFVRELDPLRYQTTLNGVGADDNELPRWLEPAKPILERFIRHGRMPWYRLNDLKAELHACSGCLLNRYDIVHFLDGEHSGQFLPRLIRLSRFSKVRTVASFHQPAEIAREVINGSLLKWFDQIVLVSPCQVPFFRQYVPADKLHVILHGVDTDFFHPANRNAVTDNIHCITVGHWMRDWNVFKAVALQLREFTFHVVTTSIKEIPDLPNIRVYSGVDDGTLATLYKSADILFLPLVQCTANNALLEGIACGLPAVVTDLESVRAYLPNSEGIFVGSDCVNAFVEALQRLGRDVGLRYRMGARARMRAEELAWRRIVHEYEALYSKMMDRCSIAAA